jgi:hypothetical protein
MDRENPKNLAWHVSYFGASQHRTDTFGRTFYQCKMRIGSRFEHIRRDRPFAVWQLVLSPTTHMSTLCAGCCGHDYALRLAAMFKRSRGYLHPGSEWRSGSGLQWSGAAAGACGASGGLLSAAEISVIKKATYPVAFSHIRQVPAVRGALDASSENTRVMSREWYHRRKQG